MNCKLLYFGDIDIKSEPQIFDSTALLHKKQVDLVLFNLRGNIFSLKQIEAINSFLNCISEHANKIVEIINESFYKKSEVYEYVQIQKIIIESSSKGALDKLTKMCNKSLTQDEQLLSLLTLFEISIHPVLNTDEFRFHFSYCISNTDSNLYIVLSENNQFKILIPD